MDGTLIWAGRLERVAGTPFGFRRAKRVGSGVREGHEQLLHGRVTTTISYSARASRAPRSKHAVSLHGPIFGRTMRIATAEPGVQLRSGNFLDGTLTGISGPVCRQGDGLCPEAQHFPDSPNRPSFPSAVPRPVRTCGSTTVHSSGTAP